MTEKNVTPIKMHVPTTPVIDVQDWDDLVTKVYGRPYCLQQQDGCYPQDSTVEVFVAPDLPREEFRDDYAGQVPPFVVNGDIMGCDFEVWKSTTERPESIIWERNFYPDVNLLARDLYDMGYITDPNFIIEISW